MLKLCIEFLKNLSNNTFILTGNNKIAQKLYEQYKKIILFLKLIVKL